MNENDKKMFLGLYKMILADSEVHPNELKMLYEIGKEKGCFSENEIQQIIFSPNTFVSLESLSDNERIEYLYNLSRMAWADGNIDDKEKEILEETSKRLGFAEENVKEIAAFLLEQAKEKVPFEEVLQTIQNT